MGSIRAFVAVEIPSPARDEVMDYIRRLSVRGPGEGLRWVSAHQLHITLKFLGNTSAEVLKMLAEKLSESLKEVEPFSVRLKEYGFFYSGRVARVMWLGVGEGEEKLQDVFFAVEEVASSLGFARETRRYTPHVTLARIKNKSASSRIISVAKKETVPDFTPFEVDSVVIMKSELLSTGARYSKLHEVKLKVK